MSAVIVQIPPNLSSDGLEMAVRLEEWGWEVDVRPAHTTRAWTPIRHLGGDFQIRPAAAR